MAVWDAGCCGIDVHAKMLVACVLKGGKKEVRTFATNQDGGAALPPGGAHSSRGYPCGD
jgi:hypothetical protein